MNITVLAVGTKMPRWVDEAVGEYAKRFGRDVNYARFWWYWMNAAKRRLRSNWRNI